MDVKEIKDAASLQNNTKTKIILDRIRKNLMTLMCQSDIVELTGNVDAFGGEKDVAANISKAVFSLFCLGSVMGVDILPGLEKMVQDAKLKSEHAGNGNDLSGTHNAPAVDKPAEKSSDSPNRESKDEDTVNVGGNAGKIAKYRKSFEEANSVDEADRIWKKEVCPEKTLSGPEKAALQPYYACARKRLVAA